MSLKLKNLVENVPDIDDTFDKFLNGEIAIVTDYIYDFCGEKCKYLIHKYKDGFLFTHYYSFMHSRYFIFLEKNGTLNNILNDEMPINILLNKYFLNTQYIIDRNYERYIQERIEYYKKMGGYKSYIYDPIICNKFFKYKKFLCCKFKCTIPNQIMRQQILWDDVTKIKINKLL